MRIKRTKQFELIRDWAKAKGIYRNGDSKTQTLKLMEEVGELSQAILKRDDAGVYDAVGDCVVVLTNVIELYEREKLRIDDQPMIRKTIEYCVDAAYEVIAQRSGKMIDGTFVKDE